MLTHNGALTAKLLIQCFNVFASSSYYICLILELSDQMLDTRRFYSHEPCPKSDSSSPDAFSIIALDIRVRAAPVLECSHKTYLNALKCLNNKTFETRL